MSERHNDIDDDEIRIISSNYAERQRGEKHRAFAAWAAIAVALMLTVVLVVFFLSLGDEAEEVNSAPVIEDSVPASTDVKYESFRPKAYAALRDTVVNGMQLGLLCPMNAVPSLEIGQDVLADSSIVMALQAADIRRDNGEIAGSFVAGGELRGKGEAKAGFCSIINSEITLGVADATPNFEKALLSGCDFFRQYPLVVGGQIVENKPKGRAVRKALAELDGKIYAVISHDRLTFHDFSQALVDLGVRNAIYLVGANSLSLYRDADGKVHMSGDRNSDVSSNINFIVWR